MPTFEIPKTAIRFQKVGAKSFYLLQKEYFDAFNPKLLGLGDIRNSSVSLPAICALFDLQGFTIFCRQIEPHLSVPIFLSRFLDWIFEMIKAESFRSKKGNQIAIWHNLPIFMKFMGDGVMVIWDTTEMDVVSQHNLIATCDNILNKYKTDFFPKMSREVVDVPPKLRCGIAKGTVFSVGDGNDFVGSCINMAARLQKLHGLSICFNKRGFQPGQKPVVGFEDWVLKKVSVRGIGDNELVYALKDEF